MLGFTSSAAASSHAAWAHFLAKPSPERAPFPSPPIPPSMRPSALQFLRAALRATTMPRPPRSRRQPPSSGPDLNISKIRGMKSVSQSLPRVPSFKQPEPAACSTRQPHAPPCGVEFHFQRFCARVSRSSARRRSASANHHGGKVAAASVPVIDNSIPQPEARIGRALLAALTRSASTSSRRREPQRQFGR